MVTFQQLLDFFLHNPIKFVQEVHKGGGANSKWVELELSFEEVASIGGTDAEVVVYNLPPNSFIEGFTIRNVIGWDEGLTPGAITATIRLNGQAVSGASGGSPFSLAVSSQSDSDFVKIFGGGTNFWSEVKKNESVPFGIRVSSSAEDLSQVTQGKMHIYLKITQLSI